MRDWLQIQHTPKVEIFVQELDEWVTIALPPKIDPEVAKAAAGAASPGGAAGSGGDSPSGGGGGVASYNCLLLKYVIAKHLKLSAAKEDLKLTRIYKCAECGQAMGYPLKSNVLINPKESYVCAYRTDTPVQ
eukprot:3502553-Pyramimonas_sp.AAC.1